MKLVGEKTIGDKADTLRIIPEDADDLWVLCNHMAPGDVVVCESPRKISTGGDVHSRGGARVSLASDSSSVRVRGRVAFGAGAGSFHTLHVAPGRELRFRKRRWDPASVQACAGADAIETLLVTHALYGSGDVEVAELVKKRGGNAMVFSIRGSNWLS